MPVKTFYALTSRRNLLFEFFLWMLEFSVGFFSSLINTFCEILFKHLLVFTHSDPSYEAAMNQLWFVFLTDVLNQLTGTHLPVPAQLRSQLGSFLLCYDLDNI